jgi:hypothetical protein
LTGAIGTWKRSVEDLSEPPQHCRRIAWSERFLVTAEVAGSSPVVPAIYLLVQPGDLGYSMYRSHGCQFFVQTDFRAVRALESPDRTTALQCNWRLPGRPERSGERSQFEALPSALNSEHGAEISSEAVQKWCDAVRFHP